MENQAVLDYLSQVNDSEARALDFIKKYGRRPSGIEVFHIYSNQFPLDLNDQKMQEYYQAIFDKYRSDRIIYHEDDSFLPTSNVELSKVDRYMEQTPHTHEFFEIECVLKGTCIHMVEQQKISITKGDIVIVPPNVEHQAIPEDDCVTVNIKIKKRSFDHAFLGLLSTPTELSTYLSRTLYSKTYRSSCTFHCGDDVFIQSVILMMYGQQIEQKAFFHYILEGMMLTLFSYLMQNHASNIEISNFVISNNDRMSKIIAYINHNHMTATLKSVAKQFYLSEQYLSSLIHKETGSTFSSLLREIKIQKATTLLLSTELKIDEICENCGYQDTTQFIKTFKNYHGLSPRKFRLNARGAQET